MSSFLNKWAPLAAFRAYVLGRGRGALAEYGATHGDRIVMLDKGRPSHVREQYLLSKLAAHGRQEQRLIAVIRDFVDSAEKGECL